MPALHKTKKAQYTRYQCLFTWYRKKSFAILHLVYRLCIKYAIKNDAGWRLFAWCCCCPDGSCSDACASFSRPEALRGLFTVYRTVPCRLLGPGNRSRHRRICRVRHRWYESALRGTGCHVCRRFARLCRRWPGRRCLLRSGAPSSG